MAQIIKFFGWLLIGIIATLVVLGHIVMLIIYDFNYLIDTIWPADPEAYSSIWYTLASLVPGAGLWMIGYGLEKFEAYRAEKPVVQDQKTEENKETSS